MSDADFEISQGIISLDIPVIRCVHEDILIPSSKIVDVARVFKEKLTNQ